LETGGEFSQRAVGDEDAIVTEKLLGVDEVARGGFEPGMIPRGEINVLVGRFDDEECAGLGVEARSGKLRRR
jgi:hypothetical protein